MPGKQRRIEDARDFLVGNLGALGLQAQKVRGEVVARVGAACGQVAAEEVL